MKRVFLSMLSLSLILVLADCDSNENGDQENHTPVLSSLSPSSCVSHMPAFTLTASGSKFTANSRILFNGIEKETTFISSAELQCQIGPADTNLLSESHNLSTLQDANVSVLVRNPSNEGGDSNSLNFTICSNHKFMDVKQIFTNISNQSYWEPSITNDNAGNIYVVWAVDFWEDIDFIQTEIYFSYSKDGGKSWSQAINVSNNTDYGWGPKIIADKSGNLYVTWYEPTENNSKICFCKSTDGGFTWSESINLLQYTQDLGYYPDIAIDTNGNMLVAWDGDTFIKNDIYKPGIYYRVSKDNGASWSDEQTLTNLIASATYFSIASGFDGSINATWYTSADSKIYFRRTIDSGETWSPTYLIPTVSTSLGKPDIAEDPDGVLYVVWPDQQEIYFSYSSDDGATWSSPVNLSNTAANSYSPVINVDCIGNINIAWTDLNSYLYYIRSINGGKNWSSRIDITKNKCAFMLPDMTSDNNGNINIVGESGGISYTGSTR